MTGGAGEDNTRASRGSYTPVGARLATYPSASLVVYQDRVHVCHRTGYSHPCRSTIRHHALGLDKASDRPGSDRSGRPLVQHTATRPPTEDTGATLSG